MLALSAVIGVGVGVGTYLTDAFRGVEVDTVDIRFSIRGDHPAPDDIVVVAVDDHDLQRVGDERWPFTHDVHADVVDRLRQDEARR